METALTVGIALFRESPIYWAGVTVWLLGFATYLPAACGRSYLIVSKTGVVLCWLGFAVTLLASLALDARYDAPPFERPTLAWDYWFSSSTQIWLLWIIGGALVIASWLRWFTPRVGWLGVAAAMVGVIASWFVDDASQQVVIEIGTAIVAVLLAVLAWRNDLLQTERDAGPQP
jgi:hypothetical protein